MIDERLNKTAQLLIVIGGYWIAMAALPLSGSARMAGGTEQSALVWITGAFLTGLAVRYCWVVLLLEWPFRVTRMTLLLGVGIAEIVLAGETANSARWLCAFGIIAALGAVTEFYNFSRKQWRRGSPELTERLRCDHVIGGLSAAAAACVTFALLLAPGKEWAVAWGAALVVVDWARLIAMIRAHQRLMEPEA